METGRCRELRKKQENAQEEQKESGSGGVRWLWKPEEDQLGGEGTENL